MPWGVGKRDACPVSKPWAVYKILDGGGEQLVPGGCHMTRDRALAHQRALYASEPGASSAAQGLEHLMREHMIVPVEWKAASGGTGELEGYASVFGNVDQGGDVVLPGAFKKTLADWSRSKQPLPLIADHELSTDGLIGSVKQAREDSTGLWVRAGFSGTDKAQDIRTKMIEGHLRGMSFTYETVKHYMGTVAEKSVRYLQELKLFEATVTPFPMNTLALASAKSAAGTASLDFAGFAESMRAALGIGFEPARKAAVDLLISGYRHEDLAAETADGPEPTADAAAATPDGAAGTAEQDAASYALGFLTPPGPRDGAPDGEPPGALAYPQKLLESARDQAALDALEAKISQALGRAAP
jgi:HK97 family phage prohead protease